MSEATGEAISPRAEQQRARILAAARQCFVTHGFHAASMSRIAEQAGMSQGLIYRYFESKHAIILAIIEQALQQRLLDLSSLPPGQPADLVAHLAACGQRSDADMLDPVLFLEMSAEASREPQVAAAMCHADQLSRGDLCGWLRQCAHRHGIELPEAVLEARAQALQCYLFGIAILFGRDRDRDFTPLAEGLAMFIEALASRPA